MSRRYGTRRVFLATDDAAVLEEFKGAADLEVLNEVSRF
jgi:hypothetical protein